MAFLLESGLSSSRRSLEFFNSTVRRRLVWWIYELVICPSAISQWRCIAFVVRRLLVVKRKTTFEYSVELAIERLGGIEISTAKCLAGRSNILARTNADGGDRKCERI